MLIGIFAMAALAMNVVGAYANGGWPAALCVCGGFGAGVAALSAIIRMERDL